MKIEILSLLTLFDPKSLNWQIISFASSVVTILSAIATLFSLYSARKQTKKLNRLTESLPTQYLGDFPAYLPKITELINRATRIVRITCIIPIHGAYSAPESYFKMIDAIRVSLNVKKELKVLGVFPDEICRRGFLKQQLLGAAESDWNSWKGKVENKDKIQNFIDNFSVRGQQIESLTEEKFFDMFEEIASHQFDQAYRKAEIRITSHRPQIYMWIIDEREAVFAIPTLTPKFTSNGFSTFDTGLIKALISLHEDDFSSGGTLEGSEKKLSRAYDDSPTELPSTAGSGKNS